MAFLFEPSLTATHYVYLSSAKRSQFSLSMQHKVRSNLHVPMKHNNGRLSCLVPLAKPYYFIQTGQERLLSTFNHFRGYHPFQLPSHLSGCG
uniref:Uncharacterized protein n=1 Tax=Arion vulgaris TaxID=1028688 RepID=A0A0B7AXN4_9EUPU